jgi:hypothetical protein
VRLPYTILCTLLGLALGWLPMLLHGPIAEKYDVLYIRGATAVWGWYSARLLIGFVVGITVWPRRWWLRGPLCGLLMMFPLGWVSLATPGCGFTCQFWNAVTGTLIGLSVAGLAFAISGREHP